MPAPVMTGSLLPDQVVALARRVVEENKAAGRKVAVAESCTGGLVAAAITEIPGSSAVLDRGFVTYSNEAKMSLLGVSLDVIRNWERAGLIRVPRNSHNNYRLFGKKEIERMRIIRMLSKAGYSHMALLRMFLEFDKGNTRDLRRALDTPRPDEDIFSAADRWLTTLHAQEELAQRVIRLIEEKIETGEMRRP